MLNEHLIEIIVGVTATIGALIILLNKFDLLHFGKREEPTIVKVCTAHKEITMAQKKISDKVDDVHDNQIKNITLHQQHQKRFDDGDKELKSIKGELKHLCVGIAILLDRSGGKPKSFRDMVENLKVD